MTDNDSDFPDFEPDDGTKWGGTFEFTDKSDKAMRQIVLIKILCHVLEEYVDSVNRKVDIAVAVEVLLAIICAGLVVSILAVP